MIVNAIVLFIIGAVASYFLIDMKKRGKFRLVLVVAALAYGLKVVEAFLAPVDWRVSLSNSVSFAVLILLPVFAVRFIHRFPSRPFQAQYWVMSLSGLTLNVFQYAGLGLAFVLGVR